jgi:hypothetical protein
MDGKRIPVGGFKGPGLTEGALVNVWSGCADGAPTFVAVRTAPTVDAVWILDNTATEHELPLSDVIPGFGLRFGARPVAEAREAVGLRVHSDGSVSEVRISSVA